MAFYIYEKNNIAKQYQQILLAMKDFLLIENSFLINFWAEKLNISNYLQN